MDSVKHPVGEMKLSYHMKLIKLEFAKDNKPEKRSTQLPHGVKRRDLVVTSIKALT